jgi:GNAT superfamily N-acetyltransferase
MPPDIEILTVDETNLDRLGFFCYKSKRKTRGYALKQAWLRERFVEGMRLHMLHEDGVSKGFIEYIPGQYTWRAVHAPGYLVIHCMWVVGKAKGKRYGSLLLYECIQQAQSGGFKGVAFLASRETWLADKDFFLANGFELVDTAPPDFSLVALSFNGGSKPCLPSDWEARAGAWGDDLTVIYTDQCPYIDRMKQAAFTVGDALGISARGVRLESASEVQEKSPSPYGVYNIVYRGQLVVSHPIGTEDLMKLVQSRI